MTNELYDKIVCALMHNLNVCDGCRKCGPTSSDARMNIIKELVDQCNKELPWREVNVE